MVSSLMYSTTVVGPEGVLCYHKPQGVKYGMSMPSPQLTEQAASIGTSPIPLTCFHHVLLLQNNTNSIRVTEMVKLNFINCNIITLKQNVTQSVTNFKHGYEVA